MTLALLALSALVGLALIVWALFLLAPARPSVSSGGFYQDYPRARVTVGSHSFRAALADSARSRARGLSGRDSIADDQAMLFTFPRAARHFFWMKDMLFPIDIIWIKDGRVVDVSENLPVPPARASLARIARSGVRPKTAVNMVMEVNAGLVRKAGIKVGDEVKVEE